jgi:hypothetical protein
MGTIGTYYWKRLQIIGLLGIWTRVPFEFTVSQELPSLRHQRRREHRGREMSTGITRYQRTGEEKADREDSVRAAANYNVCKSAIVP